jgi:hypothetical protein
MIKYTIMCFTAFIKSVQHISCVDFNNLYLLLVSYIWNSKLTFHVHLVPGFLSLIFSNPRPGNSSQGNKEGRDMGLVGLLRTSEL